MWWWMADDVETVRPEGLQHGRHLRLEHGDVAGNHGVRVRPRKRRPRMEPHARIDPGAVFAHVDIGTTDRDLEDRTALFALVADDLRKPCGSECARGSGVDRRPASR